MLNIQIKINPVRDGVEELFTDIDTIQVLGIQSEFIESLDEDSRYSCYNLEGKIKQTKIAKEIKKINNEFNVLLFGSKQPAWSIFEEIKFDSIILETQKNMEQMHSIIQQCKKYKYIYLNGIYINEELLKRLHKRNEYYCGSHHPLRERIMGQTGKTEVERKDFLQKCFNDAKEKLIHVWEPEAVGDPIF